MIAAAAGLIFTGICIGIGFATSRILVEKLGRAYAALKAKLSILTYNLLRATARVRFGMDGKSFDDFAMEA